MEYSQGVLFFCFAVVLYFLWQHVLLIGLGQGDLPQLFLEQVKLVEKDNERRFSEEDVVQHLSEQFLSFEHSVCVFVLPQGLVVVAQGNDEHH